jgi:hypothetical protein
MLTDDFEEGLKDLSLAFGIALKPGRIEVYQKMLKHIPLDGWTILVKQHIRRGDRFPTIKQLLESWDEIREDRVEGDSGAGDPDCPDCYGEGRLYFMRTYEDMRDAHGDLIPYETMGRCARCSMNRGNRRIGAIWRGKLEDNPNVIKILNEAPAEKPVPKKMLTEKELAVEFGEIDEEELRFREAERRAILEEQRRSLNV